MLTQLWLNNNRIETLPAGIFSGLTNLEELNLDSNPGAPFRLTLRLVRTDSTMPAAPSPATVAVHLAEGAPFNIAVGISATAAYLSASAVTVAAGSQQSDVFTVTQASTAPIVVRLENAPAVPNGYRGVGIEMGPPLVLFDMNRPPEPVGTLAPLTISVVESPVTVEVGGAFRDPDGDRLTYGATTSSPGVASVAVSGSLLTVTPQAVGTAAVVVTATDASGSNLTANQTLAVTVCPGLLPGLTPAQSLRYCATWGFTDHPLMRGVPVKAVHFTELRTRIDAVRSAVSLGRFPWSDAVLLAGVTPVRLVHLLELRSALDEVHSVAGRAAPSWSDAAAAVRGTTPIRAAHLMELRAAVVALE